MTQTLRALIGCAAIICAVTATPQVSYADKQQAPVAAPKTIVNLNTATIEQLTTLPGVGPKTAQLILEYRAKNGGFKKIEELMNIKGIGEKSFLKLKPLVSAPPKTDAKTSGD